MELAIAEDIIKKQEDLKHIVYEGRFRYLKEKIRNQQKF
jgi:hypothetical protein